MLFGICQHMSHTSNFWHTYVIMYSDFMVIVKTLKYLFFLYKNLSPTPQCHTQTFFGQTFFLKLRIGQFSDTQKTPMVIAECPKIFDVQCIWGRIFVSLEKIFVFKCSQNIFRLVFTSNIQRKRVTRTFWVHFFGHPSRSNSTKIYLDAALHQICY